MVRLRTSASLLTTLIAIAAAGISVNAQTTKSAVASTPAKPAMISLSIAVPIERIPMGQKPWVHLTVTNLGSEKITYPQDRVHVEGPNGEPPTTLIQRQATNQLRPGDVAGRLTGYRPSIAPKEWPGHSIEMQYDLSYFYEIKEPGKYTVYIEVYDELAGKADGKSNHEYWVRSPVATFEVLAPK